MTPHSHTHTTKSFSVSLICPTHPHDKAVLLVSSVCATCCTLNRDGGTVHLPCSLCTCQAILLSHRGLCSHMITTTLGVGAVRFSYVCACSRVMGDLSASPVYRLCRILTCGAGCFWSPLFPRVPRTHTWWRPWRQGMSKRGLAINRYYRHSL
jgi:hypothetical protein